MEQHGDAATEKNISTIEEAFADCALPTPPGPAPLWGPGSIPNNWADVCGSLSQRIQIGIGKCACTAHFPSPAKLLAYVQPINVAIMRHCSTWISSIGTALSHIMMSMTDEFSSKNVPRHVHMGTRKDASAKPRATIRSLHERATLCTCPVRKFVHPHEVT